MATNTTNPITNNFYINTRNVRRTASFIFYCDIDNAIENDREKTCFNVRQKRIRASQVPTLPT